LGIFSSKQVSIYLLFEDLRKSPAKKGNFWSNEREPAQNRIEPNRQDGGNVSKLKEVANTRESIPIEKLRHSQLEG
jgi:hypothetical protein